MDEKIKMIEKNLNNENERKRAELEKMRKEIGEKGGAGHFWGNDRAICDGGVRNWMEQAELEKVLRLLAVGEKKINLKESEFRPFLNQKKRKETQKKFYPDHNWNIAEAGWTLQFKSAWKDWNGNDLGGDGENFWLWIGKKGKN